MPREHERSPRLTEAQARRREQVLTQPEPTKVRESSAAVVLKQGSVFLLSDDSGDVPWKRPHGLGLFFQDCRFLDGYRLTLNGRPLTALSWSGSRGYATHHDLANPELDGADGSPRIAKNTLGLRRQRLISGGVVHELLTLENYGREPAHLWLELSFRATFEDIFVLRGFVSEPRGEVRPPRVVARDTVELGYLGSDGVSRVTEIVFLPPPSDLDGEHALFAWTLDPGERRQITITLTPSERPAERDGQPAAHRSSRPGLRPQDLAQRLERAEEHWLAYATEVHASNPLFDRVLRRALVDLWVLRSRLQGKHYFAAGIPWFATLFGRDAAVVALQTLPYGPATARDTLELLAKLQATEVDPYRDAEPGKILHEFRQGELAHVDGVPQSPTYYGTVDATMLFLILLAEYVHWSGDLDLARSLRPNVDAALHWMAAYADHDRDGYLDYVGEYEQGLVNQGWKDAGNAIVNADGSRAQPPIALCEVQSYAYRAWRESAILLRALGDAEQADELDRRADDLRTRFERDFWSEELGCYILARQRDGRPAAVVSSNAGQVLWGGIAAPERAARVVERLLAPDMFSGWGIRTLSARAQAYNPISYHLGSVWPHDNGLIACGFRHYGHDAAARQVFDVLFDAAASMTDFRLPELYCGYDRREREERPVRYPVASSPQAWAAGAIPHALWDLLGLRADALHQRLDIVRPCLPTGLDWIELKKLPVGAARVDLRFERSGPEGAVQVRADVREGTLQVEQTGRIERAARFRG